MPARLGLDKRATISKNLLFGALEEDELDEFLDLSVPQRYPRDRVIFSKGDPGDGLYVIADGRVGIKTISKHGKEIFLNIMEKGEVFGEIALLDGKERTAGAVAMESSQLLFISRERFIPFVEQRPNLSTRLLEVPSCSKSDSRWMLDKEASIHAPYSNDLRTRVVMAVRSGETCRSVAKRFGVSVASVVKWSQRYRVTGSVSPDKMGGYRRPLLDPHRSSLSRSSGRRI